MFKAIFFIIIIGAAGKALVWGLKAVWGVVKLIRALLLFPLFLAGLALVWFFMRV